MHHRPDHLARREELAAVGVLLAHLQQQVFIHLRQGEEVGVVHVVDVDLVHLVQDVAQVRFRIHPHAIHRSHDAADDALLARCRRVGQAGAGVDVQTVQVRQQFLVDEVEQLAVASRKQLLPLPAHRLAIAGQRMVGLVGERRGPVLPAERAAQCGCKTRAHGFGLLLVANLLRVEDAQEQNPGQLGNVLQRTRAVGAPHYVADALDESGQGLRGHDGLGCLGWSGRGHLPRILLLGGCWHDGSSVIHSCSRAAAWVTMGSV